MYSSLRYLEAAMPPHPANPSPQAASHLPSTYLALTLPILLGITISGFFKYRSVRKQYQIRILEQIWQQDVDVPH